MWLLFSLISSLDTEYFSNSQLDLTQLFPKIASILPTGKLNIWFVPPHAAAAEFHVMFPLYHKGIIGLAVNSKQIRLSYVC